MRRPVLVPLLLLALATTARAAGLPGDADGNGVVDLADARLIAQRVVNGQTDLLPPQADIAAILDAVVSLYPLDVERTVTLERRTLQPRILLDEIDLSLPGSGEVQLEMRRVMPHDPTARPYLGPFGYGWVHPWDARLE